MKFSVFFCLAYALLALSPLQAQFGTDPSNPTGIYRPTPISPISSPTTTKIVVARYIHDGTLIYEYTPAGVRRHFDDLSLRADPLTVAQLQPLVDRMAAKTEKAKSTSLGIGIGGGILTLGLVTLGILQEVEYKLDMDAYQEAKDADPRSPVTMPEQKFPFWFILSFFAGI